MVVKIWNFFSPLNEILLFSALIYPTDVNFEQTGKF